MTRNGATARRCVLALGTLVTLLSLTTTALAGTPNGCAANAVTSYPPVPSTDTPFGITQGPGGTWYSDGNLVVQVNGSQQHAIKLAPSADAGWLGWDGSSSYIWYADFGSMGTVDARGRVTVFDIPDGSNGIAVPEAFVFGPGPYVWFTDNNNDRIGRLDPSTRQFTFYNTPSAGGGVLGLVRGRDGALYFSERNVDKIGRLAPDGSFREWSLGADSFPNRMTVGPDGNIWFTELDSGKLGRIDASRTLTEFAIDGGPVGITTGADGQLYVGLWLSQQVARVDTSGHVTATWSVPGALIVTSSRDGIWAADPFADTVASVRVLCSNG